LGFLSGLKNSVAFLTIIPVGMDADGLGQAAKYMPVFPVIGAIVGGATGILVWGLAHFLPALLAGFLGLGFLLLVNGVQHTDGLLDFGDGIMCHGSRSRKLKVMRDPQTGAGGFTLGLIVLLSTAVSIASLDFNKVIGSLTAAEAAAKFAMVLEASIGKSAHKGMNTLFIQNMHIARGVRLGISFVLMLAISTLALQLTGFIVCLVALCTTLGMLAVATKAFGGITGDVMGATSEVTRLITLIVIQAAFKWL
jgi:adenosylcobinamide-GDP ribazoletransferase